MVKKTEKLTIGEENIIAAVLNILQNSDLISREALNKVFEKLELPQEYKGIYNDCSFRRN